MAKQKVQSSIRNTSQCDAALHRIGDLQIEQELVKGDLELEINKLKAQMEEALQPLLQEAEELEQQVKLFGYELFEIEPYKTKTLVFGELCIHKGKPSIVQKKGTKLAQSIEILQRSGKYSSCVKVKHSLDKAAVKNTIPDDQLHRYGLELKQKTEFKYSINREKIEAADSLDHDQELEAKAS